MQAVANQTLKEKDSMAVAKAALLNRLQALGRAHDVLMDSTHAATTLRAAIEISFHSIPLGRVVFDGPDVKVGSKVGLALSLAFHELATNAVKYGALSSDNGRIEISWSKGTEGGQEKVNLTWRETGGPEVSRPTDKGFGSKMIERALASYVSGTSSAEYLPEGLVFHMTASLRELGED